MLQENLPTLHIMMASWHNRELPGAAIIMALQTLAQTGRHYMSTINRWLRGSILTLLITAGPGAIASNLDDPAAVEALVDGIVVPLMKSNSSPSGTVAIARNGELLLAKGYGFEDIEGQEPVDPYETLFRPGSVSKLFTWVAVMQLVEQGKLDLDTDVNTYLQDFKIKDTFKEPITLRHILTPAGFEDGALGYLIVDDPARAVPLGEAMERYQPLRVNAPGAQTAYSNYATALAGHIVASISGLSFTDYIEQNIFDPLGMENSSFVDHCRSHSSIRWRYTLEAGFREAF
jgi:CubicO group peptidase (beta-lactamase class C family)